jgi:D-serine deaminase-like pyridoxal phosphate-dependent protein
VTRRESPDDFLVLPDDKGLRLPEPVSVGTLRHQLHTAPQPVTADLFAWPLLALDDDALAHNIATLADFCTERGFRHAPHVKTPMSPQIWARQAAAGAWAATLAAPHQLRTAIRWGAKRVLLANELVDPREAAWLRAALARDAELDVWVQVDSPEAVALLAAYFGDPVAGAVRARLHVLIEYGVADGRTGVRTTAEALALARSVADAGLTLGGVTGYEGPVAGGTSPAELAAVAAWCRELGEVSQTLRGAAAEADLWILSVGGSAYLDIVATTFAPLTGPRPLGDTVIVIRAGAYVTHDHVHYADLDPWSRLPGGRALRPAITIWSPVLSVPQPGLALLGVGRRDVSFDLDLPQPLWHRDGPLRAGREPGTPPAYGPRVPFAPGTATIDALNDQHAFLRGVDGLRPGDLVGLGISHPCTALDRWRVAAVTRDDPATGETIVHDLYTLEF